MTRTTLAVFLAVILPSAAAADDRGGRHEVRQDKAAIRDDLHDAQLAQQLLNDFDDAAASRNSMALSFIEGRVRKALRDELREASHETRQQAREAERSVLEGDRADAAKDRRDFMMKAEYRHRVAKLNDEWDRLLGRRRPEAMHRKHEILVELVRLSRFEIRADVGEIHEDRGEHRR